MRSYIKEIHRRALIVDSHADTLSRAFKHKKGLLDFPEAQLDLKRLKDSGVKLQFLAVFVNPAEYRDQGSGPYLEQIAYYHQLLSRHSDILRPVYGPDDLMEIASGASVRSLLCVEGGESLEGKLSNLYVLYDRGVRSLGLTWNYRNALGGGAYDSSKERLTDFGRQVIDAMNQLGMLVDVSHLSEASFWDALHCSKKPVIASHANCRRLKDHPRNLTDHQMKSLARTGSVMGITLVNDFLGDNPGVERVVDHIIHAGMVMGIQFVGLGTDFDGVDTPVPGLEDASQLPRLTEEMLRRGLSEAEILSILGENTLRILRQVV